MPKLFHISICNISKYIYYHRLLHAADNIKLLLTVSRSVQNDNTRN